MGKLILVLYYLYSEYKLPQNKKFNKSIPVIWVPLFGQLTDFQSAYFTSFAQENGGKYDEAIDALIDEYEVDKKEALEDFEIFYQQLDIYGLI